jgi:hypothetical protein
MAAKSGSLTFLTSDSKTHPLGPRGTMTRTYLPFRSPITQRKSVSTASVIAVADGALGSVLRAACVVVVTFPNTGVSSWAWAGGAVHSTNATSETIKSEHFIFKPP